MNRDAAIHGIDAFPNSNQAQPPRTPARQDFVKVKTGAVVTHGTLYFMLIVPEQNVNPACLCVLGGVGEGLLDEAINSRLHPSRQTLPQRVRQVDGKAATFGNPLDQILEAGMSPRSSST